MIEYLNKNELIIFGQAIAWQNPMHWHNTLEFSLEIATKITFQTIYDIGMTWRMSVLEQNNMFLPHNPLKYKKKFLPTEYHWHRETPIQTPMNSFQSLCMCLRNQNIWA